MAATFDDVELLTRVPPRMPGGVGGVLLFNRARLGMLKSEWSEWTDATQYRVFVTLDGKPLLEWQTTECPTCEKLLLGSASGSASEITRSAGAINALTIERIRDDDDWWRAVAPIVRLLTDDVLLLEVDEYVPTDGDGHLFWNNSHKFRQCGALSKAFVRVAPTFLTATQPTACFRQESFDAGLERFTSHPGIALHLGGRMSALLDGHHRALAAALRGQRVRCVTISTTYFEKERFISLQDGRRIACEWPVDWQRRPHSEFVELSAQQFRTYHACMMDIAETSPPLPQEFLKLADQYPRDEHVVRARMHAYTDDQIEDILAARRHPGEEIAELFENLLAVGDPRTYDVALRAAAEPFAILAHATAYRYLATIRNAAVEDLFVDFLVNDEGREPEIRDIIDEYFAA